MPETSGQSNNDSRTKESSAPRIRRRNRMITSCLECRRRKLKCDKLHPCTNCSKFSRDCMFLAPALDSVSQKKLNELKDKMGSLEKVLENDIARKGDKKDISPTERHSPGDLPGEDSGSDREVVVPEDEKPLEPNPLAVSDAAYEDSNSTSEDLLDLGVRLGRMRLTERFGGTFRPRFAEELASSLGEPVNINMADPTVRRLTDHEDFLAPGPTFIAPGSGFIFGDVGSRRNLIDFLPSKAAADALAQKYYQRVHFIARVVHWPSFQLQYESFWTNVLSGFEPIPSLQAIIFAVLFSAVASVDEDDIYALFGSGKASILTNFQTATEVALGKANYLRTTKIETLQAMVIYLIPMVRDEVSRAHSVLVGSAIRLAECMGLHRDPENFGMSPVGTHIRRIVWFQLCYLDFRTAETQSPRPYIKRDDYDTRFPLDINDVDLMAPEPKEQVGVWTDMTLTRLRFECAEMWRVIGGDAERLRLKKISITYALGKVESFRRAMEAKYYPVLDTQIPIQAYARHFLNSAMSRMHVSILHRFHHSVHVQIPDRLREILITNAIEHMENFIALQKTPEFADWGWISTSITTWNAAMLLVLEIYVYPQRREADRIWSIIDYTFQPDMQLSTEDKARQIMRTIRDRSAFYRDMRQIREPLSMPSRRVLTVRMREQSGGPVGPESILLKKEESEVPLQNVKSHGGSTDESSSRKQSFNETQAVMSHTNTPPQTTQAEPDNWTFDSSSTLFMGPGPGLTRGPTPNSRLSSISPAPPANVPIVPQRSIAQVFNPLPGVENGPSPGSSSTNTDAWPPPISNDHQGWNVIGATKQHQRNVSADQRLSTAQPSTDQLPNTYLPQAYPVGQLPYVAGSQSGVETMLQPANPGYLHDEPMSLDIDWGEWDKIFPPDTNTGNLDRPNMVAG